MLFGVQGDPEAAAWPLSSVPGPGVSSQPASTASGPGRVAWPGRQQARAWRGVVWSRGHAGTARGPSLQHDVLEVLLQDGVLHGVEHEADVLGVDGGGEVVEQRLATVPALAVEALHQEALHVVQPVRVAPEVGEVLLDADGLHLVHQEVRLVEEQDDGHVEEELVVDDRLEDVHGLHQPVGAPVLHEDLVILAGGHHEQDGRDPVKALEPLLALRALASHVHHLKGDFLNNKVMLHDALGGFPRQQDVLLTRKIVLEDTRRGET